MTRYASLPYDMQLFNGLSRSAGIGEKIVWGNYSRENVQENVRGDRGIVLDGCSDPRKGLQVSYAPAIII